MGLAVVRLGEARCYHCQSLEFLAETRILAEMKIENCGTKYFLWESILFFL